MSLVGHLSKRFNQEPTDKKVITFDEGRKNPAIFTFIHNRAFRQQCSQWKFSEEKFL